MSQNPKSRISILYPQTAQDGAEEVIKLLSQTFKEFAFDFYDFRRSKFTEDKEAAFWTMGYAEPFLCICYNPKSWSGMEGVAKKFAKNHPDSLVIFVDGITSLCYRLRDEIPQDRLQLVEFITEEQVAKDIGNIIMDYLQKDVRAAVIAQTGQSS